MSDEGYEQNLRETLRDAVPSPPNSSIRTAGARAYARRARRARVIAAAGAVAVVIAAAVTVPSVLASTGSPSPGAADRPHVRMPVAHPFTCPAKTPSDLLGVSFLHGKVPTNLVLARICPLGATAGTHSYWTAPADPLVTDVPALVRQLNALPLTHRAWCPTTRQPAYTLTFQYRNGQTVTVRGETGTCDVVDVAGSLRRSGATTLLRDYLTGLSNQRSTHQPRSTPSTHPACPPGSELGTMVGPEGYAAEVTSVLIDVAHPGLLRAEECAYGLLPGNVRLVESGALSGPDLRELDADMAAHATQHIPGRSACSLGVNYRGPGPSAQTVIEGVDAWGSTITLTVGKCMYFTIVDHGGTWYWTPTIRSERILGSVFGGVHHSLRTGTITGRLLEVGGPAPGLHRSVPGTVTLEDLSGSVRSMVATSDDGTFTLHVRPGQYRLVGHSPYYQSDEAACLTEQSTVTVGGSGATKVNVICEVR